MKKEHTLKVTVKQPYAQEAIPDQCSVVPMPDTWVSDAMMPELSSFCPGRAIIISAPTGSGKTAFVTCICKRCQKEQPGRKVLLLENRTAVAVEKRREFAKALGSKWAAVTDPRAFELIDDLDDVGLVVMTYQKLSAHHRKMDLRQFAYVILDECHYFLADSTFNQFLDKIFWQLPQLFRHAVRVYSTATPGAVLEDLCNAEGPFLNNCRSCLNPLCQAKGKLRLYEFPRHFEQVQLFYFRTRDEIASLVASTPGDRFLIFTAAREDVETPRGDGYYHALDSHGVSAAYLDAGRKGTDVWREVCDTGAFHTQALIATSVLDCGVSFHDPKLKHIVVETADKTGFLQMIGRRRLKKGETLNVYIRALDAAKLTIRMADVRSDLAVVRQGFSAASSKGYDALLHKGWNEESEAHPYRRLLNYLGDGRLFPKLTAYHFLRWQEATLARLLHDAKKLGDDSALPRLAHEWLDQPDGYDPAHWLSYHAESEARNGLAALLEPHRTEVIPKNEWPAFSGRVLACVNQIQKFAHDSQKTRKPNTINKRLCAIGVPYRIIQSDTGYLVERTGEVAVDG